MAYSINPNLPRARATAMRLLVDDQLPICVVARKCGVHRSTIWRWKRKWSEQTSMYSSRTTVDPSENQVLYLGRQPSSGEYLL